MEENKIKIDSLQAEALSLYEAGYLAAAEIKYKEILDLDINNAEAWRGLGTIYYVQEQYQDALEMLYKSLKLDSSNAIVYYNLGLVKEKIGYLAKAVRYYEKAIALNPYYIEAYHNLGKVFSEMGLLEQAETTFVRAIAVRDNYYINYLNLANILMMRQQINEAIASYKTALQLNPGDPLIFHSLAIAFLAKNEPVQAYLYFGYAAYYQGQYLEAISNYQNFLQIETGDVELYISLADCYQHLHEYAQAIQTYRESLQLYPQEIELYLRLAIILQDCGQTQAAIELIDDALLLFPDDISLKLEHLRIFPIIYNDIDEIAFYRERFTQGLANLIQPTFLNHPEAKESALKGIGWRTNFYLQYQGYNDLELQKQYGQFVHKVMAKKYPQWLGKLPLSPLNRDEKIRIGYISDCFHWHTVGIVFMGWLKNCDRQHFDISSYYINSITDELTQQFQIYSDRFHHIPDNLEAISQQIIADKLHILVFLDIGMTPQMTQLAALRLAPIQCAAWGHPVTTGLPTIDYFISSDLMEPSNAKEHYSETLIRLPNIGISYPKPIIPELSKSRSDFHLRSDAVVYLSCQSLFKYLPQYDYIFGEIAQQVPQAQFVFVSHLAAPIIEQFRQRLQRAFAKFHLESEEYCVILPRQNQLDYWNLNLVSDIFLDTFGFTGFLTTLESIACNLPVVTCPGEFMRSRQSYGILKMLGVTETIANNETEYIEIAVRLSLEREWRYKIVEQIKHCQNSLYEDKTCVAVLQAFYHRIIQGN
ncbi:tetratricopeptide repeat protein [Aerosakkonema sp. BLCC-F183]|uniref:tetratricopeptide repeat protein n=1 Tax=Aerosakkonema sp. BLCC-F183 TaxID=3342834 RepID=UPI0035BAE016